MKRYVKLEEPINLYFQVELKNKSVEQEIVDEDNQIIKKVVVQKLSEQESSIVIESMEMLAIIEKSTKYMEGRKYPTINYSTYAFEKLMNTAIQFQKTAKFECNRVGASRFLAKLELYYSRGSVMPIAALILDPSKKKRYGEEHRWGSDTETLYTLYNSCLYIE